MVAESSRRDARTIATGKAVFKRRWEPDQLPAELLEIGLTRALVIREHSTMNLELHCIVLEIGRGGFHRVGIWRGEGGGVPQ